MGTLPFQTQLHCHKSHRVDFVSLRSTIIPIGLVIETDTLHSLSNRQLFCNEMVTMLEGFVSNPVFKWLQSSKFCNTEQ